MVLALSCSKKINNNPQTTDGGQDSGGGGTLGSTYEQVEYYFKNETELKRSLTEILYNLLSDHGREYDWLGNYKLKNYANENLFLIENKDLSERILDGLNRIVSPAKLEKKSDSEEINENPAPIDWNPVPKPPTVEGVLGSLSKLDSCEKLSDKECVRLRKKNLLIEEQNKKEYEREEVLRRKTTRDLYIKNNNINTRSDAKVDYRELFPFDEENAAIYMDPRLQDPERFVEKLKIKLSSKDFCLDRYKNKKAASVESFTADSSICVSAKELEKTPPESLQKQIHALLIHEIMHTLGFYEDDATLVQKFVLENYDDYFRYGNINYTIKKTLFSRAKELKTSIELILITYQPTDFGNEKIYSELKFNKNFESLKLQAEDVRYLLNGYIIDLKKKDLNQNKKSKIIIPLNKLDNILEELDSLFGLFERIQHYHRKAVNQPTDKKMYKYNKPENYMFIYNRLEYLSEKLNSIGLDLNKTSTLNESEPGILPPR